MPDPVLVPFERFSTNLAVKQRTLKRMLGSSVSPRDFSIAQKAYMKRLSL